MYSSIFYFPMACKWVTFAIVQSQLVVTAVHDSGTYSWLCIVSSTSKQQRAVRAAADPFIVSVNVAFPRASRIVGV